MLLYAFVILVVIICLILYKFFSVIESLVNQYSSDGKKEKFSNFNEDNISIKTMLKKRGSTPSSNPQPFVQKGSTGHQEMDTGNNLIKNERLITQLRTPETVSIPANKVEAVANTGDNYTQPIGLHNGKYTFPIGKLMYDGVWDRKIVNVRKGYQGNDWNIPKNEPLEGSYSTKKFFHNPELNFIPGEYVRENGCGEKTDYYECCD